jgi:hypothetical protein
LDQLELKSNGSRQNHISAAENFPMLRQNFGGYPKRIKTAQFQYWELQLVAQENHLL